MPEVRIEQSDIDSLVQKLATLESQLSANEHALLSVLLGIAFDAIGRSMAEDPASPLVRVTGQNPPPIAIIEGPIPSIVDQFAQAFTPGPIDGPIARPNIPGGPPPIRPDYPPDGGTLPPDGEDDPSAGSPRQQ